MAKNLTVAASNIDPGEIPGLGGDMAAVQTLSLGGNVAVREGDFFHDSWEAAGGGDLEYQYQSGQNLMNMNMPSTKEIENILIDQTNVHNNEQTKANLTYSVLIQC